MNLTESVTKMEQNLAKEESAREELTHNLTELANQERIKMQTDMDLLISQVGQRPLPPTAD